jgi:hypothetical protein
VATTLKNYFNSAVLVRLVLLRRRIRTTAWGGPHPITFCDSAIGRIGDRARAVQVAAIPMFHGKGPPKSIRLSEGFGPAAQNVHIASAARDSSGWGGHMPNRVLGLRDTNIMVLLGHHVPTQWRQSAIHPRAHEQVSTPRARSSSAQPAEGQPSAPRNRDSALDAFAVALRDAPAVEIRNSPAV